MKQYRSLLALPLVLLASIAVSAPAIAAPAGAILGCNAAAAAKVVVATNAYRASLGLTHLTVVPKLHAFAVVHADDMARSDVLTHSSSSGQSFAERAHSSSYAFDSMRENVAVEGVPAARLARIEPLEPVAALARARRQHARHRRQPDRRGRGSRQARVLREHGARRAARLGRQTRAQTRARGDSLPRVRASPPA